MAVTINVPSQVRTFANLAAFPASGSLKTIYIAEDTNKTYRWTGSVYVEISASAAGGATWGAITGTLSSQTDLQNALNAKEPTITAGTTSQYYRGDKSFQTLDKSAVGLSNVDNTSDANKPVSTATQTALNAKQDTLVSGTSIKTVNSTSLLGSGDVAVQPTLVSGTNIKTIEGQNLLGSGDINLTATDVGLGNVDNTSDVNKPVSTAQATAIGLKQDTLVSGTNIKTINGSSLLGAGDLSVGTLKGVHAILPLQSGTSILPIVNTLGLSANISTLANRIVTIPFIPNNSFVSSSLNLSINTSAASGLARILIYSNLNGRPDQKIYESASIDCSTVGIKTALVSFTFTAGEPYWIAMHFNTTAIGSTGIGVGALMSLQTGGVTNYTNYQVIATFGSAPTTFGTAIPSTGIVPYVGITAV